MYSWFMQLNDELTNPSPVHSDHSDQSGPYIYHHLDQHVIHPVLSSNETWDPRHKIQVSRGFIKGKLGTRQIYWPAVMMILLTWFDQLEESFTFREKNFANL